MCWKLEWLFGWEQRVSENLEESLVPPLIEVVSKSQMLISCTNYLTFVFQEIFIIWFHDLEPWIETSRRNWWVLSRKVKHFYQSSIVTICHRPFDLKSKNQSTCDSKSTLFSLCFLSHAQIKNHISAYFFSNKACLFFQQTFLRSTMMILR